MLQDGQIIERGTHHQLLEQQGAYYEMYMSQFRETEDSAASTNGKSTAQLEPGGD
jgi:ATP-binding cassette subfamily B protein